MLSVRVFGNTSQKKFLQLKVKEITLGTAGITELARDKIVKNKEKLSQT